LLEVLVRAHKAQINVENTILQSQAAAQAATSQIEQSPMLTQLQLQIEDAIHAISGLVTEEVAPVDLKTVVIAVENSFEKSGRRIQKDVTEV
jgi:hypothetical protein